MLANLAVQQLLSGHQRLGFQYLRSSIELAPEYVDHWNNLGAFYATNHAYEQARLAYTVALKLQPNSRTAHAAIARAYTKLGSQRLAKRHERLARRYQRLNPFYHYSIAQRELHKNNPADALVAINLALGLNSRLGGFHFLKAIALQQLGNTKAAARSMDKARRLGKFQELKREFLPTFG